MHIILPYEVLDAKVISITIDTTRAITTYLNQFLGYEVNILDELLSSVDSGYK